MLIKLPINRLKDRQGEMTSIADRMEKINDARIAKLIEINADKDHTLGWKSTAAEPLKNSPELVALNAQMRLLVAVIEEQKNLWRDSAALLRDAAVPRRDQMGTDTYGIAMSELNFFMSEAGQMSGEPLQAAVDAAALAEDWKRLHCLLVGKIDRFGHALTTYPGMDGTPLDCLPLPGRDESEAIFLGCELAKLRADGVMLCLSSGDLNPTADSSRTKLARNSSLISAQRKYDELVKQRDRLRSAMTALERWELLKNGAPKQPTFDEQVKAALSRAQHAGLDDSEATVPEG